MGLSNGQVELRKEQLTAIESVRREQLAAMENFRMELLAELESVRMEQQAANASLGIYREDQARTEGAVATSNLVLNPVLLAAGERAGVKLLE
jgi:hypothetical protein